MPDRYAVMGHPIAHSKSPFIHQRFAAETGEALAYDALHVEPGGFPEAVERFRAEGGLGLNVTIPFKEEAFALASRRTRRAERAGAVNTMWFEGESDLRRQHRRDRARARYDAKPRHRTRGIARCSWWVPVERPEASSVRCSTSCRDAW